MNTLRRRHVLDAIVDRPRTDAAIALAAAWLAFMAGLFAGGEVDDISSFVIAGGSGVALVFLGFAAASRVRPRPRGPRPPWVRLALLSLAIGIGLGVANLAANWAIAESDPRLRALLLRRFARVQPLNAMVAAPLVEEVAVRLFLLSAIAWVVSRFTRRGGLVFGIALVASSCFFALLHLDRPMPDDVALANYYRAALLAKYTLAALPLGWVFWRWGLPYAILCHAAVNAAHIALEQALF